MKKTDFFITYHHGDEMAARWIAAVLKQAQFSTLSDSWDFLPGETPLKKIEYMFGAAWNAMVLISRQFLQPQPRGAGGLLESASSLLPSFNDLSYASLDSKPSPFLRAKSQELRANLVFIILIEAFDIRQVLGAVEYLDLADIDAKEAEKRLLEVVGGAKAGQKETEPLPIFAGSREELLAQRKRELGQLLDATIKNNYHMKLDLEQEVEKEIEVKNEKTGVMEKRKEWVWVPVPLETLLRDGKNYLLVNPSGLGKTTFLTYVAGALLDREENYPFLPLFFTCIGLNNRAGTIEDFIRRQVESVYTGTQGTLVSGAWENLCVLLDALDQARDVDDIVSSLLIHDRPLHYKKAKIILSSRQNTADKVKAGFAKIRLKLPEAEEVQHYLGEENYQKLAGTIEASGELVKAPVLLEMLKTITEKGHVVSTLFNRAGLYTEFTKVLLDQERSKPRFWQDKLSIRHFIDFELEQVLEKIAFFSLAENEILEIPKEKLAQYCESPAKKEALLNIGILLELFEDREQKIVFRHQSFQAYFAARYIYYQRPDLFKEITKDIRFFYNDAWYEMMRFFGSLEKDSEKARRIIDTILLKSWIHIFFSKKKFLTSKLEHGLRLIFAVLLASDTNIKNEKVRDLHTQLDVLLKDKNRVYCDFFISNIDKFNQDNAEHRISLIITFLNLLRDNEREFRKAASKALFNIGDTDDNPFLGPPINVNYDVRFTAKVLEKISTTKDIPLIEQLLRDDSWYIRLIATEIFRKICTIEDIHLLKPLLSDEKWLIRKTATSVLGSIIFKNKDITLLKYVLGDEPENFRQAFTKVFWKIVKAKDISLMETLIRCEVKDLLQSVSERFWNSITSRDISLIEHLIIDKDWDTRSFTARAIGDIGTSDYIPILETLLRDENENVRRAAATALENIVTTKHIPLLKAMLNDKDFNVRKSAAYALRNIGALRDIHLLETLLRDENWLVSYAAAEALGRIALTSRFIPIFNTILNHKDINIRWAAIDALGNFGTSEHIPLIESKLNDENVGIRSRAIEAVGNIGTSGHVPLLLPLLKDDDRHVRSTAVKALGKIGTTGHISLLEPLLKDDDEHVRSTAVKALGMIGATEHISLLEPLLMNVDWYVHSDTAAKAIEVILKRSAAELQLSIPEPAVEKKAGETVIFEIQSFIKRRIPPLHILHISDIHYALENDPTITCIFHEFLEDITKWRSQQNQKNIQAICLTGDIAATGQKEQYAAIHEKINAILDTTGCARENLFIIPGNHDVQEYDQICAQGQTLLEQARENKINIDTGVLSSAEHYRLFLDKFANFYRFIEKYGYVGSQPENRHTIPHLPNPWYNRKLKEFPVRIMGLNSALFCLKGYSKYGDLRMGSHQFHEAYFQGKEKAGDRRDPEVVILLTHHPLNWLAETEYDDYSTLMERYAVLHLHGHIHKTKIVKEQKLFSSSGGYVSIGTGSLYGEKGKEDINTYHIITLDFENQELHVWARRWNPETGKWTVYDDDGNNRFRLPVKDGS